MFPRAVRFEKLYHLCNRIGFDPETRGEHIFVSILEKSSSCARLFEQVVRTVRILYKNVVAKCRDLSRELSLVDPLINAESILP